jgi:peptide subunit release factor 1 (eRF1)
MEKQRGQGGAPERQGGKATCECPKCGHTIEHTERGTPCNEIKCPKCGATMGPPEGKHGFDKVDKDFWNGVV